LSWALTGAAKTGNRHKPAFAWVETLQLRAIGIEKINASVRANSHVARRREAAETSIGLRQRPSALRSETENKRIGRRQVFDVVELWLPPSRPAVEQPRRRIVWRPRNRREHGDFGWGSCFHENVFELIPTLQNCSEPRPADLLRKAGRLR